MNSATTFRNPLQRTQEQSFIEDIYAGGSQQMPSDAPLYGRPASAWRRIAMRAAAALQSNPNDDGARQTLESAQGVLREHATRLAQQGHRAGLEERGAASQPEPSGGLAFTMMAANPFRIADELAGGLASAGQLVRGRGITAASEAQAEAEGRYRSIDAAAREQHPVASFLGDLTGGVAMAPAELAVLASTPVGRSLLVSMGRGGRLGASGAERAGAAVSAGAIAAPNAAARGFGEGEGLGDRFGDAAVQGALAFPLAALTMETPMPDIPLPFFGRRMPNLGVNPMIRSQRQSVLDEQNAIFANRSAAANADIAEETARRAPFTTANAEGLAGRQAAITANAEGTAGRQGLVTENLELRNSLLKRALERSERVVGRNGSDEAYRRFLGSQGYSSELIERTLALRASQRGAAPVVEVAPASRAATVAETAPPTPAPSSSVAEAASGPLPSTMNRPQRGATRGQLERRAQQLEGARTGGTSAPRSFVDIIRQLPPDRIPEAVGQLSSAQLRVLWQHVQLARATGSLSPELDNVLTQAARSRMATLRAGAP